MSRITTSQLQRILDSINAVHALTGNAALSLDSMNPGDGRTYAVERNGHRLHSGRLTAKETQRFLDGLVIGLYEGRELVTVKPLQNTKGLLDCPSCQLLVVNGVLCYERGCPDAWRDETRECRWCGSRFTPEERDQRFCDTSCSEAYLP